MGNDILVVKKAIIECTATLGWRYIVSRADQVLKNMADQAFDEEDKVKREDAVMEVRAARKFWKRFQNALDASKQVETSDSDDWNDVSLD